MSQVFRLGSNQGVHIPGEEWVARCHALRGTELLPDVAGEIFVRRLPALRPMLAAVLQVKWAAVGFLVNDALQILNDLRDFLTAAHEGGHKVEIDADSKGFAGGIHRIYAAHLLDGALVEHIRLALQLSVVIQHFQRTQEVVRGIIRERKTVRTVIDQAVFCGERIIEAV